MPYEPVLLARINKPESHRLEGYRADGGYAAFERALKDKKPADVVAMVKDSGLRGRGGAGFPCGLKWTFLPKDHPGPIYLCVNADESEPCTFNNRILMEKDPHQTLEGVLLACYAIRSSRAYYYIRYEYGAAYRALQSAIDELYAAGLLGQNILGSGFNCDIYMHRGAAAYICGEETGLIESLEGKRAWPRIKPPFPAIEGAFRKPTIVNNVETLACVTQIARRGKEWFQSIGVPPDPKNPRDAGSYGPKLYCVSGHVNTPGCWELPLGVTSRDLIDNYAGGVWKGRKAKAVVPGGLSMGFLSATELDVPLDFAGPSKVGCLGLGTAALTVIDDQTSMIDVLHNTCQFYAHESCGQCTPCREGTAWMLKITDRMRRGLGRREDLDILIDVADRIGIIPGTTICGLADGAGWPVKNAIRKFRQEFEDAIKSGYKSDTRSLTLVGGTLRIAMKTKWIIIGVVGVVVVVAAGIQLVRALQTAAQRSAANEELKEFSQAWLEFQIKNLRPPASLEELRPYLATKSSRAQERADTLEVIWGTLIGSDLAGPDADKRVLAITKESYGVTRVYLYQNGSVRFLNEEEGKAVEKARAPTAEELAEMRRKILEQQKPKNKS